MKTDLASEMSKWLRKIVCWGQGHNLVGVDLPVGWSMQTCRTCGERIRGFRRPADN